jgi:hypothetical protein
MSQLSGRNFKNWKTSQAKHRVESKVKLQGSVASGMRETVPRRPAGPYGMTGKKVQGV